MKNRTWTGVSRVAIVALLGTLFSMPALAGDREQAKRIHDRLAGVPPTDAVLTQMTNVMGGGTDPLCPSGVTGATCAAYIAMNNVNFYNVTLKNFAAPWTNRDRNQFVPLNDYIATVIGMIRDEVPFNTLLSDDITYVGLSGASSPPAANNNNHYMELEANNVNLRDQLDRRLQSTVMNIPGSATAGVMTSRAASEAFFIAGTNRAMFRFTLLNHLCNDMEQMHDPNLPTDRIRQDVSRSPGGDSRLFLNNCVGCHTGMDPMAQAFAYYNYNDLSGALEYTPGNVQPKYFNNDLNFPPGFRTPDDSWDNYWRTGQNRYLGFDPALTGSGQGAKSLGQELGNSHAFASCQVKKVFRAVCMRAPENLDDRNEVSSMIERFRGSDDPTVTPTGSFSMKQVFADAAVYCMGD